MVDVPLRPPGEEEDTAAHDEHQGDELGWAGRQEPCFRSVLVCMYMYIYIYTYTYVYIYIPIPMYIYIYTCLLVHTYAIRTYIRISIHATNNNQQKMICLLIIRSWKFKFSHKHCHSTQEVLFHIKSFMVKGKGIEISWFHQTWGSNRLDPPSDGSRYPTEDQWLSPRFG